MFWEFLIMGKNNPRTYKRIIINEVINIALTALIFILYYFSLSLGINSTKLQGL